jgi:hypothetical protein
MVIIMTAEVKARSFSSSSVGFLRVGSDDHLVVRIGEYLIIRKRVQRKTREFPQLIHHLGYLGRRVAQSGTVMKGENDALPQQISLHRTAKNFL